MSTTNHLAKAKDYIAKGEEFYRKAAEEIQAARAADHELTWREIDRQLGRGHDYARRLVQGVADGDTAPFGGEAARDDKARTRRVLRDPEQRKQAIASLAPRELEAVRAEATEAAVERSRASRREHDTTPTTRELTGGEKFEPSEYWADKLVIRINNNARELASLMKRGGGLLFGSMEPQQAFEYLLETEQLVAEARAAAQEHAREKAGVS